MLWVARQGKGQGQDGLTWPRLGKRDCLHIVLLKEALLLLPCPLGTRIFDEVAAVFKARAKLALEKRVGRGAGGLPTAREGCTLFWDLFCPGGWWWTDEMCGYVIACGGAG